MVQHPPLNNNEQSKQIALRIAQTTLTAYSLFPRAADSPADLLVPSKLATLPGGVCFRGSRASCKATPAHPSPLFFHKKTPHGPQHTQKKATTSSYCTYHTRTQVQTDTHTRTANPKRQQQWSGASNRQSPQTAPEESTGPARLFSQDLQRLAAGMENNEGFSQPFPQPHVYY